MHAPEVSQPLVRPGQIWHAPPLSEVLRCALPHLGPGDGLLLRALAPLARTHIVSIHGVQHIRFAT